MDFVFKSEKQFKTKQVIKMSENEQEQEIQREAVCVSGVIFYRDTENNLFYEKWDKKSVGKWHQDPYQIEWVYSDDEDEE